MCGRYYIDIDEKELKDIIDTVQNRLNNTVKTGEIYPTNITTIITSDGINVAKWGFPKWDKKGVVINARSEELIDKRMFKNIVNTQRCIIPASGFFEWKENSTGKKDKYYIKRPESALYMAGLFNTFKDKSEQLSIFDIEKEQQLSYVIITKAANKSMSNIHDRMPLILNKEEMRAWLQGEDINFLIDSNDVKLEHSIA